MKYSHVLTALARTLLLAALAAIAVAPAQAQQKPQNRVVRAIGGGVDGDSKSYQVRCADGTEGHIVVKLDSHEVCVTPRKGQPRCRNGWSLQDAGRHLCTGR